MIIESGPFGSPGDQKWPEALISREAGVGEVDEAGASITGRQRQVRHRPLLIAACALVVALGVVYGIRRGEWFFALYGFYPVGSLAVSWRPPTVVSADGVRRPWRRPGRVSWTDVVAVVAPQPGLSGMRLQLTSGKKMLLDIPGDRTAAVAAIGGKEVVLPARPVVRPAPPRAPGLRTDQHVLADVTRQAAALARQREELAEQSRRLRPS